ncbi:MULTISPECIES: hypothetical protein [unclassified Moorena]|uniref:hypothetical protein n=1 Tax=unclassified Moorena TaxID=2683338 RepID=UPI001400601C|nr:MULTISPECIES: hypothetical protein [unclassified Moorena]NEO14599.1 hypothetical protein [Moorena sp. SIO3E8]NEQ02373.1 hypothetical protein [Moorena sp. SIO3F7]
MLLTAFFRTIRYTGFLPVPCSLLPAPYSLFPIPCSLFPVPCSLSIANSLRI